MSKEFDKLIEKMTTNNGKELDIKLSHEMIKDISDIKQSVSKIEAKINSMEIVLDQLFELINNITIFIDDAEDIADADLVDEEDWTPYDDRNFTYDDKDEEEIGGDDYWSSHEDEN